MVEVEDVEQKSRREDVLNQILLLLNTAIGRTHICNQHPYSTGF